MMMMMISCFDSWTMGILEEVSLFVLKESGVLCSLLDCFWLLNALMNVLVLQSKPSSQRSWRGWTRSHLILPRLAMNRGQQHRQGGCTKQVLLRQQLLTEPCWDSRVELIPATHAGLTSSLLVIGKPLMMQAWLVNLWWSMPDWWNSNDPSLICEPLMIHTWLVNLCWEPPFEDLSIPLKKGSSHLMIFVNFHLRP